VAYVPNMIAIGSIQNSEFSESSELLRHKFLCLPRECYWWYEERNMRN